MKTNLDRYENEIATVLSVETTASTIREVDLSVVDLEAVIAPKIALNHNEVMVIDEEIELDVEELEEVIAPKLSANHNEAMVSDEEIELEVEELEDVIAPGG